MTTIIVLRDERQIDKLAFSDDTDLIRIGRRPSNDVCVADRSVSGNHAKLQRVGDAVWIEDLDSTNGTYVNGQPIDRQRLHAGDDVLVGKIHLQVELPVIERQSAAILDDSMDASFDDMAVAAVDDEDDELDESMRAALALYSDDPEPEPAAVAPALDEDDDIDFSEDARLFAQGATDQGAASQVEPPSANIDDSPLDHDEPVTLSDRAKVALGREERKARVQPRLHAVNGRHQTDDNNSASSDELSAQVAEGRTTLTAGARATEPVFDQLFERGADPLDAHERSHPTTSPTSNPRSNTGVSAAAGQRSRAAIGTPGSAKASTHGSSRLIATNGDNTGPTHDLEPSRSRGAVIEIKNGAKSGQILPIDKPVTTLGRPGIQIAAIMRKPDGYFLMHIESDDSVDRPTLNADSIGDEPVLLHSGDELHVAGIDVEFMLS